MLGSVIFLWWDFLKMSILFLVVVYLNKILYGYCYLGEKIFEKLIELK